MGLLAQGEAYVEGLTHALACPVPWRVCLYPERWVFPELSHLDDLAFHKSSFLVPNGF